MIMMLTLMEPLPAAAVSNTAEQADSLDLLLETPFPDVVDTGDTTTIRYEAEQISYDLTGGIITLTGTDNRPARVISGGRELSSGRIVYTVDTQDVYAEGFPDTAGNIHQTPAYRDPSEDAPVEGDVMIYNLTTGKGTVKHGKTAFEKGFYSGAYIAKVGEKRYEIDQGIFTTCDRPHPHYKFETHRLTVTQGDKVVGQSAILRIADIPVFWVPFYVFPLKRGRHSGILTPRWGSNDYDGWNFTNLGYYFAPNDYWDGTLTGNIRQKTGWLISTDIRYTLRYRFHGEATFALDRGNGRQEWRFGFNHTQTLQNNLLLRGSGDVVSDKNFLRQNSNLLYERLNRTLRSYVSLNKSWQESGNSLDVLLFHELDLDRKETTFSFPRIAFRSSRRPFSRPEKSRWYQSIYYSYSTNIENVIRQSEDGSRDDITLGGRMNLNSQHKLFNWLNVTPGFDLSESWRRVGGVYNRQETYTTTLSSNATFYGLFNTQAGRIKAIRHVVKPGLSVSSTVSVNERGGSGGLGHLGEVTGPNGSVSLRLGNILQVKTERDGKERKLDLTTLDLSTHYRLGGTGRHWSDLSSAFTIKPDRRFDVRLSAGYDLYHPDGTFRIIPYVEQISIVSTLAFSGAVSGADTTGYDTGFSSPTSMTSEKTWRVNITHNYSLTRGTYGRTTSWIRGTFGFNPTRAWRINYDFNFNMNPDRREPLVTSQTLTLYRDLHDWDAVFTWTPSGFRQGYYVRIAFKEFPQIKFERKGGVSRF
ncbi:MAG: LPS-assembly protein LptD [Candidatus Latescibacteria bacterium]|nr:LPS-assembly protein LptD [Candidatus Latescibacterota bacterium]